jgi:hypothetical protein
MYLTHGWLPDPMKDLAADWIIRPGDRRTFFRRTRILEMSAAADRTSRRTSEVKGT